MVEALQPIQGKIWQKWLRKSDTDQILVLNVMVVRDREDDETL
jgi:hypothetical protein